MKAVILAGGEGKRLRPYTYILPKPLLPIGERPILDLSLERLKKQDIKEVILAVNYKAEIFEMIFGDGFSRDMKIHYTKEEKPLGTAGPIKNAEEYLTEDFLVINGDIITELNIKEVADFHKKNMADITVVTREIEVPIDFGIIKSEGINIVGWEEKPKIKSEISSGIYIFNPSILKHIPKNEFCNMNDLVKDVIKKGCKVYKFPYNGIILDVGHMKDYEEAAKILENMKS